MSNAYRIELTRSARKELLRLSKRVRQQVLDGLVVLAHNPYSELLRVKKLKGAESLYRFRVSAWRVVYTVRERRLVVLIIRIGHRRDVYRKGKRR